MEKQNVQCPQCSKPIPVTAPALRFLNFPEVSMVVFAHSREECPHCHTNFTGVIAGLTETGALNLTFTALPPEQKIAQPTGADVMAVSQSKGAVSLEN